MTISNTARKNNLLNPKISRPDRAVVTAQRFRHLLLGANGLGQASKFAEEIHVIAPELFRQRWG